MNPNAAFAQGIPGKCDGRGMLKLMNFALKVMDFAFKMMHLTQGSG